MVKITEHGAEEELTLKEFIKELKGKAFKRHVIVPNKFEIYEKVKP